MSPSPVPMDTPGGAPWAELLPELCGLVVDRLDAIGALRFPAACPSWATACREAAPRRLRPGAPTMLTSPPAGYCVHDLAAGVFSLHDVSTGRSLLAEAEGLGGRCWVGGKDDWLVTMDEDGGVELLNPITGAGAGLPPLTTVPGVEAKTPNDFRLPLGLRPSIQHVALCRTPAHAEGYTAIARFAGGLLAFTLAGDTSWTPLKNPRRSGIILGSEICSWDEERGDLPECRFKLATSRNGRILLVCMYGYSSLEKRDLARMVWNELGVFHALRISLHELVDSGDGAWRRVSGLGGDQALFVGASYPFYVTVPGGEPGGIRANCVYIADMASCDAAAFDLELGEDYSFEQLNYLGESNQLQMPMWFRPTLHLKDRIM
ncbi:hypothetical protein ACP4OV_025755 [Aristida adscensionis]